MRLLLLVVLLGLLAGDAAASTGAASLGVCDAANIAGEVAATCAAGVPTPACCEPLVASVDLGGGGDCLCSVAHETPVLHAGLNSSLLVALHSACGGALAVVSACHGTKAVAPPSGGVHTARSSPAAVPAPPSAARGLLPAAAATPTTGASSPAAAVASETPKHRVRVLASASIGAGCDSAKLGYQIERQCGAEGDVSADCCEGVIAAVDTKGCLCAVMNSTYMQGSSLLVAQDILDLYRRCDGLRPLNGQTDCLGNNCNLSEVTFLAQKNLSEIKEGNPAPVPPSGSGEDYRWAHRDFNVDLTAMVLEAVSVIGVVAYSLYRWFTSYQKKKAAEKERKMEMTMSKLHADLRREMLGDLDSTLRASLLDLLGGERPTQLRQVLSAETDGPPSSEDDIESEEGHRKNAKNKSIIKPDIGTSKTLDDGSA